MKEIKLLLLVVDLNKWPRHWQRGLKW